MLKTKYLWKNILSSYINSMLLMNDEEFWEGIVGGLGWIFAIFFIRNGLYKYKFKKSNFAMVGAVTFAFWWFIRKVGMNLYRQWKKLENIEKRELKIPIRDEKTIHIFLFLFLFYLIYYVLIVRITPESAEIAMRFSKTELPLLLFIIPITILVYLSK